MKVLTLSVISVLFLHIIVFICSFSCPTTALQPPPPEHVRHSGDGGSASRVRAGRRRSRTRRKKTTTMSTPVSTGSARSGENIYANESNNRHVNNNCSECMLREEKKRLRLDMIKAEILRQLNLDEAPNISRDEIPHNLPPIMALAEGINNPRHMQADQPNVPNEYDDQPLALVQFASPLPHNASSPNGIFFNMTRGTKIKEAILGIFIRKVEAAQHPTMVLIRKRHYNKATMTVDATMLTSRNIKLTPNDTDKWVTFDITGTVKSWISDPESNYGLEIQANDMNGNPLAVINPDPASPENKKGPYLEPVYPARRTRVASAPNICDEEGTADTCCRYPLEVNFEDMSWDYIIAPRKFHANYCAGQCPLSHLEDSSARSAVIRQYVSVCCAPAGLLPMQVVYWYDGKVLTSVVPNMVAVRCGCM